MERVAGADTIMIMNRRITTRLLVAGILTGLPLALKAGGMRLPSQDGFATARGEAFVATADNPSAIYYNPAGLAQLEGQNIRSGIYGIYFDPSFQPPSGAINGGTTYHTDNHAAAAPQFFYACSLKDQPWSFGLGIYAPFGGGVKWPQDTGFRTVGIKSELTYIRFNPEVAVKIAPGFSFGFGPMINYSKLYTDQGLRPFYQPPNTNFFRFNGDGWSIGYNVGLLWQPHEKISFGATFRSASTVTMSGHTRFEQVPGVIGNTRLPAEADFTFPLNGVVGISWRPTPKWNLEFDADYTDWSSFDTVTLHQKETPPFGVKQDIPITFKWQASWMYEFGVTRYLDDGWQVSAGYLFSENAVPDAFFTPLVPDQDRHFVSLGIGRKGKRFDVDAAYQFGYGPARTVTGSTPPSSPGLFAGQNGDGTYTFISHAILISAGMHF